MVRSHSQHSMQSFDAAIKILIAYGYLMWWTNRVTLFLAWWSVRHPILSVPLLGAVAVGWWRGSPAGVAAAIAWLIVMIGWRLLAPESFERWVWWPVVARWRRWSIYRRRWAALCALHGLTKPLDGRVLVPRLLSAQIGRDTDRLAVLLPPGQSPQDWRHATDALVHAFRASAITITSPRSGHILVLVRRADPLSAAIPAPINLAAVVDLQDVHVGVREDGNPWTLQVLGRHVLVAGATGAGKGSVIWSVIVGLAPAIHANLVSVRVIDPKGGMELAAGLPLFDAFAYDTGDQMLAVLRDAATTMTNRANRLRGHARLHSPTVEEPLILLVIDEAAALTAYISDRKIRAEVEQLLGLILSQGRAVGVSVIAAVQDPSKEVLAMRQLFPTRIGMRMPEATQAAMVLGQGARDRGARCDEIPDTMPGTAYVAEDGSADIVRVRAFYVTDGDIATLTDRYPRHERFEATR